MNRAIFIAAPHCGTSFANYKVARWVANLVTLPITMLDQLSDAAGSLAQLNTNGTAGDNTPVRIPNSIDNLTDKDPFVQLAADLPISPKVRYHSIIGNDTPALPLAQSNDGVVPYTSAHLNGAQSEKVFPS